LSTEAKSRSEARDQENTPGGLAGTIIGMTTVFGGIICLGLLIWFGL